MKKLYLLLLFIVILTGCEDKEEIDIEIIEDGYSIYAIDYNDKQIKKVIVDHEINDYIDIFELYTIYQNRIPMGYYVDVNSNVSLINSYIKDNNIYYVVDKYIYLTKDINMFNDLLTMSNKLFGYDKTFIVYNNKTFGI